MNENERAVIEAARKWAARPSASNGAALEVAVERLNANTCPRTAIGGDLAWPVRYRCILETGHEGNHQDPHRGAWGGGR